MDILTFLKRIALPFGLIGILSGMVSHEYDQVGLIRSSETKIIEQEKRVDRLESKIDNLLDKLDKQNDKIDDLRIDVLKRHK